MKTHMDIRELDIRDLKPAAYNPRADLRPGDPEYEKLKRSIREFGYVDPVIVNRDGTVIGGHQRLKVLKDLGYVMVQAVVVDLDAAQERELNIALNKVSGEWDDAKLAEILAELTRDEGADETLTGFDEDEITAILNEEAEDSIAKNMEIDPEDFTDEQFKHECPRYGFKFN